jgi:outer membrane protein assembly factor BamB
MKSSISIALVTFFLAASAGAAASTAVLTHHYDNYRTGWNQTETTLTPQNVASGQFGLLAATLTLDAQIDAQPLIVPNQTITAGPNPGTYEVVYVATEANTVYAINAANGQVLISTNLGPAIPFPLGCENNGPTVGITSTPVIDTVDGTLDLIAYTLVGGVPTYTLHALNLGDLTDKIAPVTVAATNQLTDGTSVKFNAQYQRQRPALLYANGAIYAGFGSFCDFSSGGSRGWLLGWNASNLTPFAANRLNDLLTPSASPNDFFLSSIWMSGAGPAADAYGNIYFATGNSDPSGTTYNPVTNISESVAKVSADLTRLFGEVTPGNVATLDEFDIDLGSGGVLLVPDQSSGPDPRLAVAGGKDGRMGLLNRDGGPNIVLDVEQIGACSVAGANDNAAVILYAFTATPSSGSLVTLFAGVAGFWPSLGANANIVPVVANGNVFVAAYQTLAIFGLRPASAAPNSLKVIPSMQTAELSEPRANQAPHEITGTLLEIKGSALSIKTRAGKIVMVDATGAAQAGRSAVLALGKAFSVQGTYDANGKLLATIIIRAKPSAGSWPQDR